MPRAQRQIPSKFLQRGGSFFAQKMGPFAPATNQSCMVSGYAECASDGLKCVATQSKSVDFAHVFGRQPGASVVLSALEPLWLNVGRMAFWHNRCAPLRAHIGRIGARGTHKQMGRIAAPRIVAAVANKHPLRDIAMRQAVRDTMPQIAKATRRINTVPSDQFRFGQPRPALLRAASVNFAPKEHFIYQHTKDLSRFNRQVKGFI